MIGETVEPGGAACGNECGGGEEEGFSCEGAVGLLSALGNGTERDGGLSFRVDGWMNVIS